LRKYNHLQVLFFTIFSTINPNFDAVKVVKSSDQKYLSD
jgi:hypothetical protein